MINKLQIKKSKCYDYIYKDLLYKTICKKGNTIFFKMGNVSYIVDECKDYIKKEVLDKVLEGLQND